MKVPLLHLTDIHFKSDKDWIIDKVENIISAIKDDISSYELFYFIISGDITFSGKQEEFEIALRFLQKLNAGIKAIQPEMKFRVVTIAGNHDCNFKDDNQARKTLVKSMNYDVIGSEDSSVINLCVGVQSNYWDFEQLFHKKPHDKMLFNISNKVGDYSIGFRLLNSSWMSQLKESVGSLFFPIKHYNYQNEGSVNDVQITIMHHPLSWFNPNTKENNKREVQEFLEANSDIVIHGHEHFEDRTKVKNLKTNNETIYISGNALQPQTPSDAGFQLITIDFSNLEVQITPFGWNDDIFIRQDVESAKITKAKVIKPKFEINPEFFKSISKISIPLNIDTAVNITLADVFVFPDLEHIEEEIDDYFEYVDSAELITNNEMKLSIIEGSSQSGKTSLLEMLFIEFSKRGVVPIKIDGCNIKTLDPEGIIKKAFINQYTGGEKVYEHYRQMPNEEKILLFDNLQYLKFSSNSIIELIDTFSKRFSRIVVLTNSTYSLLSKMKSSLREFQYFVLKPLGYEKRDTLIRNFHRINSDALIVDPEDIFEKTKASFDQVETVLGNKLMPAYPIFILSILEALEYAKPMDLKQTSYGYCYQSLIYIALSQRAKLSNDSIDTYMNTITEFAYNLFEQGINELSEEEFDEFYTKYSMKFLCPSKEELIENLVRSGIIVFNEGYIRFGYVYIYYFLVAKKLSELINTNQGKTIVTSLYSEVYKEENANILVFLTHHSKDEFFLESATFSSMLPFEDQSPITLEKNGEYYKLIEKIAKDVSSDVIVAHKNPEVERKNHMQERDRLERKNEKENIEEDDMSIEKEMRPFYLAFRSMEIVGQIIKNRKGSIEKDRLIEMISELYLNGFRTVSYFGTFINETKDDFVDSLLEEVGEEDSDNEIRTKINLFFQYISLQTCLSMFTKITHSVGVKDLRKHYDEVASKIGTPAAKLVSFSIKSYYDRMSIREVQQLAKEFKGNPVAMFILKSRVRSYLYNNYVNYQSKDKLIQALNMRMLPSPAIRKSPLSPKM